ncbi:MAG: GNAT family N-acetyltransferase [Candidatus Bipolaricaulia bacterium]
MPIRVTRVEDPSAEALLDCLAQLAANGRPYPSSDAWTLAALSSLPKRRQAFIARDEAAPLGLLVLAPGFLEAWGAPTDLFGGNPILPADEHAAAIHTALLLEASAWTEHEGESGLEVLLPMGPANWVRDERLDAFFEHLSLTRSYFTMTRDLDQLPASRGDDGLELAPAAAATVDALYDNYAACVAHGEIELVARQTPDERRAHFDSLLDETLGHPGSLALFDDDRLVAFALVAAWSETAAHLAWIGALPEDRGRGHGRHLLCDVMAACREQGIERISLYTDASVIGRTLYERLGFRPAGALTYRWRVPPTADAV